MATFQISVAQQNARLDAMETETGASPVLKIYSGSIPANIAAARTGTILSTLLLPSDFMLPANAGSKAYNPVWSDNAADAAGTAGYFTLFKSDGTTGCWQGNIAATGGDAAMTIDNIVFAAGQAFTITSFTLTDNNG